MTRASAVTITLTTLRFFRDSVQGTTPDATGYKGFYYHFLDMKTGQLCPGIAPCRVPRRLVMTALD